MTPQQIEWTAKEDFSYKGFDSAVTIEPPLQYFKEDGRKKVKISFFDPATDRMDSERGFQL